MNNQEFFNNSCQSLRTYGAIYGSPCSRGWGWVDESDSGNRCAIARFINGNTDQEVQQNIAIHLECKANEVTFHPLVIAITGLFDMRQDVVNDSVKLEEVLQNIADFNGLDYVSPDTHKSDDAPVINKNKEVELA